MSLGPADAAARGREWVLRALTLLLAATVLTADAWIPLGVADSVPYVAVVLLALSYAGSREVLAWAVGCSLLTLVGYGLSQNPGAMPDWMAAANRALALFAIWVTAAMGVRLQRAREQTEASRRRLAGIIDSALDGIVTVDEAQRIVLFNRAAEAIFGRSAGETLGHPLEVLIPARFRAQHAAHVTGFASAQDGPRRMAEKGELVGLRASGEEFPLEASLSRVEADGERLLTVILRDLSEARHAEEEHREAERRARTAEELASVGTLTAGIAHDVGTPMGVILGYAEMLERSLEKPRNKERATIIAEQVRRVRDLIQTLLNLARPGQARRVPVDLESTLERSLAFFQEKLRRHRIEVARRYEAVPAVLGDPDRLQQVFLNLLVNAADAMPDGGGLGVELEAAGPGRVAVRVRDTGVGIAPEAVGRVFEAFYTTKERGKGTGLGLLVARGIVLDHGGSIHVASEPGKGTEFVVELPCGGGEPRPQGGDSAPQG